MVGTSNRAFIQLAVASLKPKALKAITPSVAITDFYYQNYPNGVSAVPKLSVAASEAGKITKQEFLKKVVPVDDDAEGSKAYSAYENDHYGKNRNFITNLLLPNMLRDTPNPNFDGELTNLTIPPVTHIDDIIGSGVKQHQIIGMFESGALGQLAHYRKMGGSFILGPWNHFQVRAGAPDLPEGVLDFTAEYHRWLDYSLKGLENGFENAPPVSYYTLNAKDGECWRFSDTWPLENIKPAVLYLNEKKSGSANSINDGSLTQAIPETFSRTEYKVDASIKVFDREDGKAAEYNRMRMYWDGDMSEGVDAKGLTFTSAPFFEIYENQISGCVGVDLWVSSTANDGDFIVYLEEVLSDGKSRYIKDGVIRASHRSSAANDSWESLGAVYHPSLEKDVNKMLAEGMSTPVNLKFAIEPVSFMFSRGSSLRITITCADYDTYQHQYDKNNLPTISLYTGGEYKSSITVPFVEHVENVYNGTIRTDNYEGPGTLYFFDENMYAYCNGSWQKIAMSSDAAKYTVKDGTAFFENAGFSFVHEGRPIKDGIISDYKGGEKVLQPFPQFRHVILDTVPIQVREDKLFVPNQKTLRMDIFVNTDSAETKPCIIYIHGYGASYSVFTPQLKLLSENGYVVAGIDLRNYPSNFFPDYVHDIKGAVRFLRANADRFNIDPDRIGSYGVSLGGNSTLMLAVSGEIPELEGSVGGNLEYSSRIQAAGAGYAWSELLYMGKDITDEYEHMPEVSKEKYKRTDGEYAPSAEVIGFAGKDKGIGALRKYLEAGKNGTDPYLDKKLEEAVKASPVFYCGPDCPPIALIGGLGMHEVDIANNQTLRTFEVMDKNNVTCFMFSNTKGNYARRPEVCQGVLTFFNNHLKNGIKEKKVIFALNADFVIENYINKKLPYPVIKKGDTVFIPLDYLISVFGPAEYQELNGNVLEIDNNRYVEASKAGEIFGLSYYSYPEKFKIVYEKKIKRG